MRSAATAGIRRGSPSRTDAAHAAEAASDSESDAGGKDTAETATAPTDAPAATTRLLDKLDERDETIRAKDAAIERLHGELRDATARASTAEAEAAAAERRAADLAERLAGVERERDALRARRWWRFW
jgi:chromosome segregation ATPase